MTLKLLMASQSAKVLLIILIYFFIILTATLVCLFSINNANNALYNQSKATLVLTAQSEANKEEQIFLEVEKSLQSLDNFITVTLDNNRFNDLNYIKSYTKDLLKPAVKSFYESTPDIQGMYAYLDIVRIDPSKFVAEAWETKEKVNYKVFDWTFTRKDPTMDWYYKAIESGVPEWVEPYLDTDIKKVVISYTKPVYKLNKFDRKEFIAGIGIDITSDDLKKSVLKIKVFKTGYAFLVSKDYYFVASKEFSIKDNLEDVKNGYYKPLINSLNKLDSGVVKIQNDLIAFSKFYNGYCLFVVVPEKEILEPIIELDISLVAYTVIAILIATAIMLFLLKRINKLLNSLEVSDNIIMTIANSIEAKDPYTKGHLQRVRQYAEDLGKHFKLSSDKLDMLKKAAMLHDLGKIGIPDEILNKPGRFNAQEYEVMKQHSLYGENILKPLPSSSELIAMIKHHHEKLDGSGYPDGLKADEIDISTRIITIIDIYDALISERPYKPALSQEEAFKILEDEVKKGYLDKNIVDALKSIIKNKDQQ